MVGDGLDRCGHVTQPHPLHIQAQSKIKVWQPMATVQESAESQKGRGVVMLLRS